MSYKKSSEEYVCRRTSHYYKKKLSTKEEEISKDNNNDETTKRVGNRIEKKPKEAKLRAKEARERKKKYIERLEDKIELLEKELQKYRHSTAQHIETKTIQSHNSAFINLNTNNNNNNNSNNNNTIKINSNINTHHNNNNNKSKETEISQTTIAITTTNEKHKNIHNQQQQYTQFTEEIVKLEGIQHAFRKLYKAVFERNEDEATNSVNILRERFGVAGEERNNWIKELILKIVDIQMPLHCRLLLEHCENREEFYKLLGGSESLKQFRKVYFDQSTISTICQSRSTMMEIKQQYKRILLNLEQTSYEICEQASKLQQEINRLESSMNPLFVGRILVYLDMERKETENLQEIFPVNFYKKSFLECVHYRETMKYECDVEMCKEREEDRLERLEMLSEEENFLKDFFSD